MTIQANVQIIKDLDGKPEYVLIPFPVYMALRHHIEDEIAGLAAAAGRGEPIATRMPEAAHKPVAAARIRAGVTQSELARRLGVSQAYVSKLEAQEQPTARAVAKVAAALSARTATKRRKA